VADVLDVDHYEVNGVERALVLGVREIDQNGINDADKNWLNLHTVYTHGSGVIAAYANQRDRGDNPLSAAGDSGADQTQWAEGNASGQDDLETEVGGYETRVYFGENSPDYSVVGKGSESAPDIEIDLRRATTSAEAEDGQASGSDAQTTYDGAGGVPVGSTFRQLLYAIKFGSTNFLLSGRVNENSQVLYDRNPRDRVQKVAPWLTIDDDIYPTIVDGRILWVLDGYTTTDRFPNSELESFQTMTDDALQDESGLRTLPTDEINYMRNAVKATVDAYDGTITLYEWDDQDPILKAWSSAFPGTVKPKEDIPEGLMSHLRYPEDLFKVQRYQFARYHVTSPSDWFQGNNRWAVPEDPNVANTLQPPYRMFVSQPPGLKPIEDTPDETAAPVSSTPTWSLTSTFVPFKRNNLAAYVSVDSDPLSETYGQMRVINVIDQQQPGPLQVKNAIRSDTDVADLIAEFNRSGGQVIYGNLLTVPVGDELMYIEPVYASVAAASDSSFPILRYVLVAFGNDVGIGTTLGEALEQAGVGTDDSGEPTDEPSPTDPTPTDDPSGDPTGTVDQQIQQLLARAQDEFELADRALETRNLASYDEHIKKARALVTRALTLAAERDSGGGNSPAPSASPSPSPTS
jgi:uncharacterized membrane protein (UPF0182 family)